MKKQIFIFFALFAILLSCSEKSPTQDEIVKKNLETLIFEKMNDPKSYEFVKLQLIDSVTYDENIKERRRFFSESLESDMDRLKFLNDVGLNERAETIKDDIKDNQRILHGIDSLETRLRDSLNKVASYTYIFSFRGKNLLGAVILNTYTIQTTGSPDFRIINMTEDERKINLTPNDFPGYLELVNRHKN